MSEKSGWQCETGISWSQVTFFSLLMCVKSKLTTRLYLVKSMSDILKLYQKTILDHQKNPRNFGELKTPTHQAVKDNPICGDQIHVDLLMNSNIVDDVKFKGRGCAISIAAASIMTEVVRSKNLDEIKVLYSQLKILIDSKKELDQSAGIPELQVFEGIRHFPSRKKCATLGWETMFQAVNQQAN
ncbi:MAG: SUF system NifU family Fe-S cluster assembly protein [SAR324 cluster bacterium]|nr:SUF system NifU family Fe-S cluster assembly protein [SAR324 cluster bacterium]